MLAHLCGNDQLVTNLSRFHPFTNKFLRTLVLAEGDETISLYNGSDDDQNLLVVSGIDEVAASLIESIKKLETSILVHSTHALFGPLVTDAHGTETDRRDMNACARSKFTEVTKLSSGGSGGSKETHDKRVVNG